MRKGIVAQGFQIRQLIFCKNNNGDKPPDCQQTTDEPVEEGPQVHWSGNKPAGGAYHLHGFDQKTVAEHGQPDGIVYQENDQYRNNHDHRK